MIHDNAVVGAPLTLYKDTKSNIEALSLTEGDTFWATDLDIEGYYDGSDVIWRPNDAGWVYDAVTWTFASTTTFTVSGDVTDRFATGTKLKLTQTTTKYFYIVSSSYSSPNTTVTITGGSDYTLANAAITNPAYSYASPPDFPEIFSYTITAIGLTGAVYNDQIGYFSVIGKRCFLNFELDLASWSTQSGFARFAPPIATSSGFGTASLYNAGSSEDGVHVTKIVSGNVIMLNKAANDGVDWPSSARFEWQGSIVTDI